MSDPIGKTLTKSKKWIDYSSQEENQHYEDEELEQKLKSQQQPQSKSTNITSKSHQNDPNYLPVLSTSHQPVKKHQLENRKQMLEELRQIKANSLWIELSPVNSNTFDHLKNKIETLKNSQNKDIFSIYPSRDNKNAYDLRVSYDLCEKWIVEGIDPENKIKIQFRKKAQRQQQRQKQTKNDTRNERKNDTGNGDYRPVKQYNPQHTTSTRYQPKYVEKKKYVEKNPQTEEIEKKVEQGLRQRKKDQSKKEKGSKFYSKNPFEAFDDSD